MTRIVGISDVSVGYGSPEVPALLDSICKAYGTQGILIEPDEIARPPITFDWEPAFELRRVSSRYEDHSAAWHTNYKRAAVQLIDELNPEVLVLFGSAVFNLIPLIRRKPRKIIYHAYEYISTLPKQEVTIHRLFLKDVDLIIAPEIERLVLDVSNIGFAPDQVASIYNVADVSYPNPVRRLGRDERNGRFIWYGTLNRRQAYAQYFYSEELRPFDFDLYGRITDSDASDLAERLRSASNIRYFGVVPPNVLNKNRAENIFSLIWWNPEISPGHYYLAPNRFFTSIQAGVPPLCPPHPQCVDLINRYGCGMLLDDWSLRSVELGLRRALKVFESDAYATMLANCADAVSEALNWDCQFQRILPRIRESLAGVA
jgi:hypothetical protein